MYEVVYSWVTWLIRMGWLRSVGSNKLEVSFAEYRLFYRALLQKRPVILSILLTKATPYLSWLVDMYHDWCIRAMTHLHVPWQIYIGPVIHTWRDSCIQDMRCGAFMCYDLFYMCHDSFILGRAIHTWRDSCIHDMPHWFALCLVYTWSDAFMCHDLFYMCHDSFILDVPFMTCLIDMCCSVLQCVAVCCSVLQCVVVCCSVL